MNYPIINAFVKIVCPEATLIFTKCQPNNYDFINDRIYFNPFDKNDCGFLDHIYKNHHCRFCYQFSLNLWTILHEIGHCKTNDIIDFDEEDEQNINYFDRDDEWQATEWAINFVKNHYAICLFINSVL